jgi:hypothetical protein
VLKIHTITGLKSIFKRKSVKIQLYKCRGLHYIAHTTQQYKCKLQIVGSTKTAYLQTSIIKHMPEKHENNKRLATKSSLHITNKNVFLNIKPICRKQFHTAFEEYQKTHHSIPTQVLSLYTKLIA